MSQSSKTTKALELLVEIAEKHRRTHYAFDNSLFNKGVETYRTKIAHKNYQEITDAINHVKEELLK